MRCNYAWCRLDPVAWGLRKGTNLGITRHSHPRRRRLHSCRRLADRLERCGLEAVLARWEWVNPLPLPPLPLLLSGHVDGPARKCCLPESRRASCGSSPGNRPRTPLRKPLRPKKTWGTTFTLKLPVVFVAPLLLQSCDAGFEGTYYMRRKKCDVPMVEIRRGRKLNLIAPRSR